MPLNFTQLELNGTNYDVLEVKDNTTDVDFIFQDALAEFDLYHLEKASEKAGAEMIDKMGEYTMPNGVKADVYYVNFVKNSVTYADALANADINAKIANIQATLADHEARITTLEP